MALIKLERMPAFIYGKHAVLSAEASGSCSTGRIHEALGLELASQELRLLCCKVVPHLVGLGYVNDKLYVLMYSCSSTAKHRLYCSCNHRKGASIIFGSFSIYIPATLNSVMVIVFWWSIQSHDEATYFIVGTYVLEEILLDSLLSHIVMTLHRYLHVCMYVSID